MLVTERNERVFFVLFKKKFSPPERMKTEINDESEIFE